MYCQSAYVLEDLSNLIKTNLIKQWKTRQFFECAIVFNADSKASEMAFKKHFVVIAALFLGNVLLIIMCCIQCCCICLASFISLALPNIVTMHDCCDKRKVPQLGNSLKTSSCELSLACRCCFYRHSPHRRERKITP